MVLTSFLYILYDYGLTGPFSAVIDDLSAICNIIRSLYGLSRGFFIIKVYSFTFSNDFYDYPLR